MDIGKELAKVGERAPMLSERHYLDISAYLSTLLQHYKNGDIALDGAVDIITDLFISFDAGNISEIGNTVKFPEKIPTSKKAVPEHGGNWPSKTGNPSGGNRSNASSFDN